MSTFILIVIAVSLIIGAAVVVYLLTVADEMSR